MVEPPRVALPCRVVPTCTALRTRRERRTALAPCGLRSIPRKDPGSETSTESESTHQRQQSRSSSAVYGGRARIGFFVSSHLTVPGGLQSQPTTTSRKPLEAEGSIPTPRDPPDRSDPLGGRLWSSSLMGQQQRAGFAPGLRKSPGPHSRTTGCCLLLSCSIPQPCWADQAGQTP